MSAPPTITHLFIFINSFFIFISDFADSYTNYDSDKHIRQGVTDNNINAHQQSADNKADKPNKTVFKNGYAFLFHFTGLPLHISLSGQNYAS